MVVYTFTIHGISALTIAANVAYAGMRAQNRCGTNVYRVAAFIAGFPYTLGSLLAVEEGSCRAYGIDLPVDPSSCTCKTESEPTGSCRPGSCTK